MALKFRFACYFNDYSVENLYLGIVKKFSSYARILTARTVVVDYNYDFPEAK